MADTAPEVVIHMAAQPLVGRALKDPRQTFDINVTGTVNLLDAVRVEGHQTRVVIVVTSDRCYENRDWEWGYRESDPLGGADPYASSKACMELVTRAFRQSFFSQPHQARVASARTGNVIGGGDWGEDRLLADVMRAALAREKVHVHDPNSVRPWQHVLNPLSGYLLLAQALWESAQAAGAWNFAPAEEDVRSVRFIVERVAEAWSGELTWTLNEDAPRRGTPYMKLDSTKARRRLGWRPLVDLDTALLSVVEWYQRLRERADMRCVTLDQLARLTATERSGDETRHHAVTAQRSRTETMFDAPAAKG
jgi:CDP-glucose 4,6-dehydratase